jgi:guanylate kinase
MLDRLLPHQGRLFVVSGPSGVGKGTVINRALASSDCPSRVRRCITATTRQPRLGEQDGIDYIFLSEDDFSQRVEQGYFLEHVSYNGHCYGTPRDRVEEMLADGDDAILEIEVRGGLEIKRVTTRSRLVFLAPPSWDELENRLRSRGTDTAEVIDNRLEIARVEIETATQYHYMIVNDDLDEAARILCAVFTAERHRVVEESAV